MLRHAGTAVVAGLLAACAAQHPASLGTALAPTTSVAQADERIAGVAAERAAIEARHAERERVCYDKFFVNNCLDEARERRRLALAAQREIEVEAEHFKRKDAVDQRDKAIAEAEAKFQAEEATTAAQPPVAPKTIGPVPPPRPSSVPGRIAKHTARVAEEAAAVSANAATRAARAAAFEEKRKKSEERQREVAQRKAERAAKHAADQAAKEKAAAAEKAAVPAR
jgi:Skp family chaperone for outer membrane proteins